MGYVKQAMFEVQEAGCLWLDDGVLDRLRAAGHEPQTKLVTVSTYKGPVEWELVVVSDALRLLNLAEGDDREMIADALSDLM